MKNLVFIRSNGGTHSWEYYELKTEALVFGDLAGYRYFVECLIEAMESGRNVRLDAIAPDSHSMRVAIAPWNKDFPGTERLRIIERPVIWNGSPNMELVIFGNKGGYEKLVLLLEKAMSKSAGNPNDHLHLDDACDEYLRPRSVSLNLRFPLLEWSERNLGEWADVVQNRQKAFLPTDIDYMFSCPEPYEEIGHDSVKGFLMIEE